MSTLTSVPVVRQLPYVSRKIRRDIKSRMSEYAIGALDAHVLAEMVNLGPRCSDTGSQNRTRRKSEKEDL